MQVLDKKEYDKRTLLSLIAFGPHMACERLLKRSFEHEYGVRTLYVYEYFCTTPAVRGQGAAEREVYAPFLERVLAKREFIAPLNSLVKASHRNGRDLTRLISRIKLQANRRDALRSEWYRDVSFGGGISERVRCEIVIRDLASTILGSSVYKAWEDNLQLGRDTWPESMFPDIPRSIRDDNLQGFLGSIRCDVADGQYLAAVKADLDSWLAEYLLVVQPWWREKEARVGFLAVPIASRALFFGYLFVLFPIVREKMGDTTPTLEESMLAKLFLQLRQVYVPSLTLFHNSWNERLLRDAIDATLGNDMRGSLKRLRSELQANKTSYLFVTDADPGWRDIEVPLRRIWRQRQYLISPPAASRDETGLYSQTPPERRLALLRESLVFARYFAASPAMVQQLRLAMTLPLAVPLGGSLPAALIVGEPGSGKDQMSHIVRLFASESHAFGASHVINMATLRPNEIAAPLLLGMKLGSALTIDSWLRKLAAPTDGGWRKTLILDELNSLDIDSQGALLRVLENSEVTPLGSGPEEAAKIDALFVGVMNEEPERLTWQRTLQSLREAEPLFSGLFGEIVKEYVMRIRRLRDDLYFRFIRGGKIVIPPLRARVEDIPILFYFYVEEERKRNVDAAHRCLEISFDAYEYLMDARFKWPGNIRELQMVAKESFTAALAENEGAGPIEVRRCDVESVMGVH